MKIAILIIAYNRINSLKRVLSSLEKAIYDQNVTLIISIDKSDTNVIELFADNYKWSYGNKIVIKHSENLGLRKHVLECGDRVNNYDALIVLEDDITVTPYYFKYAKICVYKYKEDDNIAGISLYSFPISYQSLLPFNPVRSNFDVYMMNCAQSWGQIWMKKQWFEFRNWYEQNKEDFDLPYLPQTVNKWPQSSWLKYHTRYCIENNKYFVYPYESFSTNNNDEGTHVKSKSINYFKSVLSCFENKKYELPSFAECEVKYDGFFEPKFLAKYIGITDNELCVDINSQKNSVSYKRFLLTRANLPYKIVKGYSLNYKPWEANIIYNQIGTDLFLYDLNVKSKNNFVNNNEDYYAFLYGYAKQHLHKIIGLTNYVGYGLKSLFNKIMTR